VFDDHGIADEELVNDLPTKISMHEVDMRAPGTRAYLLEHGLSLPRTAYKDSEETCYFATQAVNGKAYVYRVGLNEELDIVREVVPNSKGEYEYGSLQGALHAVKRLASGKELRVGRPSKDGTYRQTEPTQEAWVVVKFKLTCPATLSEEAIRYAATRMVKTQYHNMKASKPAEAAVVKEHDLSVTLTSIMEE
jgi:hypothetical protein